MTAAAQDIIFTIGDIVRTCGHGTGSGTGPCNESNCEGTVYNLVFSPVDGKEFPVKPGKTQAITVTMSGCDDGHTFAPVAKTHSISLDEEANITVTAQDPNGVQSSATYHVVVKPWVEVAIAPGSVREDAGDQAAVVTVSRGGDDAAAITVSLASSDTDAATVPASVSIGTNVETATCYLAAVNDDWAGEADATVTISPTAGEGYDLTDGTVTVTDEDGPGTITLTFDQDEVAEVGGTEAATGTVTRNTNTDTSLTVTLTSSDTTEATVPATIDIPAISSTATFHLAAVDDTDLDGDIIVTVSATAASHDTGSAQITVTDNEEDATVEIVSVPAYLFASAEYATPIRFTLNDLESDTEVTNLTVTVMFFAEGGQKFSVTPLTTVAVQTGEQLVALGETTKLDRTYEAYVGHASFDAVTLQNPPRATDAYFQVDLTMDLNGTSDTATSDAGDTGAKVANWFVDQSVYAVDMQDSLTEEITAPAYAVFEQQAGVSRSTLTKYDVEEVGWGWNLIRDDVSEDVWAWWPGDCADPNQCGYYWSSPFSSVPWGAEGSYGHSLEWRFQPDWEQVPPPQDVEHPFAPSLTTSGVGGTWSGQPLLCSGYATLRPSGMATTTNNTSGAYNNCSFESGLAGGEFTSSVDVEQSSLDADRGTYLCEVKGQRTGVVFYASYPGKTVPGMSVKAMDVTTTGGWAQSTLYRGTCRATAGSDHMSTAAPFGAISGLLGIGAGYAGMAPPPGPVVSGVLWMASGMFAVFTTVPDPGNDGTAEALSGAYYNVGPTNQDTLYTTNAYAALGDGTDSQPAHLVSPFQPIYVGQEFRWWLALYALTQLPAHDTYFGLGGHHNWAEAEYILSSSDSLRQFKVKCGKTP